MTCWGINDEHRPVGDELQKISVMNNLPSLIREDFTSCIQRVVPRMQQTLANGSVEYNMAACEALRTVASHTLMSSESFSKVFLQQILNPLERRDAVAAEEWLNTLLDIIPILPQNVLQNEVLPIAVNKAHISKPVTFRVTSCRILGKLSLMCSAFVVKKEIVPVVIALCQDVSAEVRAAMTAELPNVAAALGPETSSCLMTYILDLNLDEDIMVREAIVEAIAHMLPRFSPEILKTAIIPYTKRVFTEILRDENSLLLTLSKFYGQYAIGLKNVMVAADKNHFLQRYITMSQLNSTSRKKFNLYKPIVIDEDELALRLTECRLNCAYNFPAMVLFATELKADSVDNLCLVLHSLASDSFSLVRRKIASGFYEVMKLMPRWHSTMKVQFIKLLKDEMDIVLEGLIPNVSNILLSFLASGFLTTEKQESGQDVGQALLICENNLAESSQWRLHEQILETLQTVPKVFHPEFVYTHFVPLLLSRALSSRILPCRLAAFHTLLLINADPSQVKQKLKIRNKILELSNSSNFQCRMLFLRGMFFLLTLSPDTLKELFFITIANMAEDKVANIRLVLCKIMPMMKAIALDPLDRKLLATLDASVSALKAEKDRDVCAQLKLALSQMEELDKSKAVKRNNIDHDDKYKISPRNVSNGKITAVNTSTLDRSARDISARNASHYAKTTRSFTRQRNLQGGGGAAGNNVQRPSERRSSVKRSLGKFSSDDFLVDAGISLKPDVVKRMPTPRPLHRTLINLVPGRVSDIEEKPETEESKSFSSLPTSRPSLGMINKNLNVSSSLPVKKTYVKPLTCDEIERELMESECSVTTRTMSRLKYTSGKYMKTENKRLSLDVSAVASNQTKKKSNINKRFSLDVDAKNELGNLTCLNNNTLVSPKIQSGNIRPQSCVLETKKLDSISWKVNSKRSMSVENLPPKMTRLASRLPVRSTEPKPLKPK